MADILSILNQPLTMGAGTVIAVVVLSVKVKRNERDIESINNECKNRLERCLKRFKINQ